MATAEYYVARPADEQQVNGNLVTIVDKLLSDLIAGTMNSGILRVFVQTFGPAGAVDFLDKQVTRESGFIVIDGERFVAEVSAKAAMMEFLVPRLMTALAIPIASPTLVYMGAVIVGGVATQFLWHNFVDPALATLEAYAGTAQTRLELYDSSHTASSGVLYRGGLTGPSSVSASFDFNADGYAERTGWVRPDDGILVRDLNGNGRIDNVTEMFGGAAPQFIASLCLRQFDRPSYFSN